MFSNVNIAVTYIISKCKNVLTLRMVQAPIIVFVFSNIGNSKKKSNRPEDRF